MSAPLFSASGLNEIDRQETPQSEPVRRRKQAFPLVLAGLLLLCGYGLWTVVHNETRVSVPLELVGYWRSSTEQYDDRYLYFSDQAVALGRGNYAESQGFPVESIASTTAGPERHLTIAYRQPDGSLDQLHLVYHKPTRTLTFKNQPALTWTKHRSIRSN
jgi:hypothetical protein